jgi:hypothetical protein
MPRRPISAFNLVELISAIAIMAVLALMVVVVIPYIVGWAQSVSDQKTLLVLNDALTRYKCEGGDMTALTSGAPTGHVLAKIASTINWNGYQHHIMQLGVTYPARSLTGTGYHQTYQFCKFNTFGTPVNPGQDILDRLASQGTPADSTTSAWVPTALNNAGAKTFLVLSNPTDRISMNVHYTGKLEVSFGDGTTHEYSGGATTVGKNYGSTANRGVVLVGNVTYIYSALADGSTAFGGDISTMPSLTYLYVGGTNTLSGSVTGMTGLTSLYCVGSNTLSGSVTGLTGLTYINVGGSNTISGSVTGLTGLTFLDVTGSNNLSGSVTGLTGLTCLGADGSNTLSGSVTTLTGLTGMYMGGLNTLNGSVAGLTNLSYLRCQGSNTLSGSVAGLTGLTYLGCTGSNTLSGSVTGLTGLTYLGCTGSNTITYNTSSGSHTWPSGTRYVQISPGSTGVFTSAMTDAILIDLSSVTTWGTEKAVVLRGNCGARTSASNTAVTTLTGKGVAVSTN